MVGEIFFGSLNIGVGYIMRELYHSYVKDNRKAEVFKTDLGWEVDLTNSKRNENATRKVQDHSETYAENVANGTFQPIGALKFQTEMKAEMNDLKNMLSNIVEQLANK